MVTTGSGGNSHFFHLFSCPDRARGWGCSPKPSFLNQLAHSNAPPSPPGERLTVNLQNSVSAVLTHSTHSYAGVAARIRSVGAGHREDLASGEDLYPRGKPTSNAAPTTGTVPVLTSEPWHHTQLESCARPLGSSKAGDPQAAPLSLRTLLAGDSFTCL